VHTAYSCNGGYLLQQNSSFLIPDNVFYHNNNFGCNFMMVWDWTSHIVGRTLGLGLGRTHCGKNTQFGTGLVTLWD
jgi:hypothetical protein